MYVNYLRHLIDLYCWMLVQFGFLDAVLLDRFQGNLQPTYIRPVHQDIYQFIDIDINSRLLYDSSFTYCVNCNISKMQLIQEEGTDIPTAKERNR